MYNNVLYMFYEIINRLVGKKMKEFFEKNPIFSEYPELEDVFDIFNSENIDVYIVGGAVRDLLLGKRLKDVDLAIKADFKRVLSVVANAKKSSKWKSKNIKLIPVGQKFGSGILCFGEQHFEITSFRKDIKSDGRHSVIEYTDDINEDAARRDFTINALYMDRGGAVIDPLGSGVLDLKLGLVRFIGDPYVRIEEDILRIMRFFRFSSEYSKKGEMNEDGLKACAEKRQMLGKISIDRIRQEFYGVLTSKNAVSTTKTMKNAGILEEFIPILKKKNSGLKLDLGAFRKTSLWATDVCFFQKEQASDVTEDRKYLLMIYSMVCEWSEEKISELCKSLKMANKDKTIIKKLGSAIKDLKKNIKKTKDWNFIANYMVYYYGKNLSAWSVIIFYSTKTSCLLKYNKIKNIIKKFHLVNIKKNPIKGDDLIKLPNISKRNISFFIQHLTYEWIKSNFNLSKGELLAIARENKGDKNGKRE